MRDLPYAMGEMKGDLRRIQLDVDSCHQAVREIHGRIEEFKEEQSALHEAHRLEPKSDRRWIVGTGLTSAGLVIAALGLLVDKA